MVDLSKFADFTEKAKQNIDQIKIGLLRHDRHPKDREFLNDIAKSVRSIKSGALSAGLPRISELCHNLENLINLIREEKKELHQEIIITIAACKDRLTKFVFELETIQTERAKVKDLVSRIQKHIDDYNQADLTETAPALSDIEAASEPEPASSPAVETSLLPEEIINKDYDKELFQIYIGQVQENISLLRTLTESFPDAPSQPKIISQCSDLVGKLQSSANYMGYDRLAEFYLQWVAELEMAGVELSMGTPVNFEFMDQKIKKIASLFPEIKDTPADPADLIMVEETLTPAPAKVEPREDEFSFDSDNMQEMFGSLDEIEDEEFEGEAEPIAALSGEVSPEEEEYMAGDAKSRPLAQRKQARGKKTIEIDSTFLEEEKESENYDEELFQIFVQQMHESISQLQILTDSFAAEPNKSNIVDQCSNLVGKLQSSANYMGYERLAEFYLQWIAELEMTGVELSIGSDISFDFMQEKIDRIIGLFPGSGGPQSTQLGKTEAEKTLGPEPVTIPEKIAKSAVRPPYPEAGKMETAPAKIPLPGTADEFSEEEEEEEEPLADGIEPIAGISDEEAGEITGPLFDEESAAAEAEEPEVSEFSEAVDEKLESFFADIEEPGADEELEASFMAVASLSEEEEEEAGPAGMIESIAGLSDEQEAGEEDSTSALFEENHTAEAEEPKGEEFREALDEELDSFFADIQELVPEKDAGTSIPENSSVSDKEEEPAAALATPAPGEVDVESLFAEENDEEEPLTAGVEPIAGASDEEDEEEEALSGALFDEEPPAAEVGEPESGEFGEAVDEKMESFFADIDEPEGDEKLETSFMEIASLTEEEPEEEAETFRAEPFGDKNLFAEEKEKELPATETEEAVGALFEEEPEDQDKTEMAEEDGAGSAAVDMLEGIDAFFAEEPAMEQEEETAAEAPAEEQAEEGPVAAEMAEEIEEIFRDEEITEPEEAVTKPSTEEAAANEPVAEEVVEDLEAVFAETSPEEAAEEDTAFADAEIADEETATAYPEGFLSDEELLEEIEGPTVGEEIKPDTESLLAEPESAEEVLSALPEDKLAEEELFRKLEGALSEEEEEDAEDIEDLTADEEVFEELETTGAMEEQPPQRRELFQKLSHALQSLEDESGLEGPEPFEEEALRPLPEAEFDNKLFDRLISALDAPSEQAEIAGARPMDHVLEEILSSAPVEAAHGKPVDDTLPGKLAPSEIRRIIRMDTDKVDYLMGQVGELSVNRSTLSRLLAEMNDLHRHYREMEGFNKEELKPLKDLIFRLGDTSVSLHRLSSDIREGVLKVRMVPISLLFDRYPDFVNTLATTANKQIELEIFGEETELEKMVVDEISEPLSRIITNAVEHGIETVDERKRLGKGETGRIQLKAYHLDNEIVIEVMDDGRGIDSAKIKARALEQGLFSGDQLYKMSDNDLKRLILNPEFSTAAVKGRKSTGHGAGLHVVKNIIEQLNGSIDISSRAGKGTLIQIRIPLNLLVIKALKIQAGPEIMALPVNAVDEIIKVRKDDILEEDGCRVITVHETTLPVFRLTEIFNIEPAESLGERVYIIIVGAEGQSIGLIVDETLGLEEIVIKPLGEFLRRKSGFSGATIIGDGTISLIPNIAELIRIASERQPVPEESAA